MHVINLNSPVLARKFRHVAERELAKLTAEGFHPIIYED